MRTPHFSPPQAYAFGWLVAWASLVTAADPEVFASLHAALGRPGTALAAGLAFSNLAAGISAAAVRPWSWHVLLATQVLHLAWGPVYVALIEPRFSGRAALAGASAVVSLISLIYFYRRRALFGAAGRWEGLERAWPGLAGPEAPRPDYLPGFAGLSPGGRTVFVAAVVLGALFVALA